MPFARLLPAHPPVNSPVCPRPRPRTCRLQGNLPFPAVLERLQLPAFELCKVLEAFVQQLPTLPRWVPGWLPAAAWQSSTGSPRFASRLLLLLLHPCWPACTSDACLPAHPPGHLL